MFSEYASKYLSKSQRPAPLFNGASNAESDVDDYLEAVSGSSDDASLGSESDSDSMNSDSEIDTSRRQSSNSVNPPSELLVERPAERQSGGSRRKPRHKQGYSLWKQNVDAWTRGHQSTRGGPRDSTNGVNNNNSNGNSNGNSRANNSHAMPSHESVSAAPLAGSEPHASYDPESGIPRSKHVDNFVGAIYLVSLAFTLATAALVSVSVPVNGGGNVYPIFAYSAKSLVIYAILAAIISGVWLHCLRHYAKAVVQLSVIGVPVTLGCTSLGSIVMSIHGNSVGWHGLAHAAMRLSALVPLGVALLWVLYLRRVKDVTGKAADIVALSADVYNECTPAMTVLTLVSWIASMTVTGLWSVFLARAFMDGKLGVVLVLWFSFIYLWTWELVCGLLRAVLASVTTAWYKIPSEGAAASQSERMEGVLSMAVYEAVTFHFSSVCLSALVAVVTRMPLLILPSRLGRAVQRMAEVVLTTSASHIMSPLVIPITVISRCSLVRAASLLESSRFGQIDKRAYRLAKLFLVAGRLCCSLLVGFLAWIHADRVKDVSSAYGYLVAIIAWFIGWTVMGASENILSMICDALLVNYALNSESPRHSEMKRLFVSAAADDQNESTGASEQASDDGYLD